MEDIWGAEVQLQTFSTFGLNETEPITYFQVDAQCQFFRRCQFCDEYNVQLLECYNTENQCMLPILWLLQLYNKNMGPNHIRFPIVNLRRINKDLVAL